MISNTPYCEVELNDEKLKAFTYAVKNHYWYQMYLDDLPIWGVVGEIGEGSEYYIFTHKKFEIGHNGKQIVDVNLTSENKVKLEKGAVISFTYEVVWKASTVKFEDRFDKYLDPNFFQHRVCINVYQIIIIMPLKYFFFIDSLVQYFQQLHDGHLFGRLGHNDPHAYPEKGLRPLQQRRRDGRYGIIVQLIIHIINI